MKLSSKGRQSTKGGFPARLAAVLLLSAAALPRAAHADAVDEFRSLLVAGDGAGAVAALDRGRAAAGAADLDALRACVAGRLDPKAAPPVPEALAGRGAAGPVLQAYRRYWAASLSDLGAGEQARAALLTELNAALPNRPSAGWDRASLDATTREVRRYLESLGLHVVTGVTKPYYELMVWTRQDETHFEVELDGRKVSVPVVFLDGFASSGWLGYASCERFGASGWAANGRSYAVRSRYDVGSERFCVSLVAHEGRHLADMQAFAGLEQPELEYRAKLTELVLSRDTTRALLTQFLGSGRSGRAAPHAHAEYWLVRHLRERLFESGAAADWDAVGDAALRTAARSLLDASTSSLGSRGSGVGFRLPD